jgi:hypothetical protein
MIPILRKYWDSRPFLVILASAAIFRLLAAVFSKGFAMLDDHFVVIELAQRWADGFQDWFNEGSSVGRSLIYPGLHYLLFYVLEQIGITDPQTKMLFVRLIHASYSILIVELGYLVAKRMTEPKVARQVGIILALFWILPFMSVRNLIEVVCIPPLLAGFYFILKEEDGNELRYLLLAGAMFGIASALRFQTILITVGVGIVMLFHRRWKVFWGYTAGFIIGSFCTQGIIDWIAWGYPFSSVYNYVAFNIRHRYQYVTGPWFQYLLLILGVLIPPTSLLFVFGFLKSWRKHALLFWPTVIFLVFHSYFPNKQERFILPILPFLIILGVIGWNEYVKNSNFWERKQTLLRNLWTWFWVVNSLLLVIVTFTYSKKNRVETLYYLCHKNDVTGVIWESPRSQIPSPPKFYLNKPVPVYIYHSSKSGNDLKSQITAKGQLLPNYVIFLGEEGIENRVQQMESSFSKEFKFEKKIVPSFIDDILHRLNPKYNVNQTSYIYKILSD